VSEKIAYAVPEGQAGLRLDVALAQSFPEFSRTLLQRAIGAGAVRLGGRPLLARERLRSGDLLEISFPEKPAPAEPTPCPMALRILYEDDQLVAIDKPAGEIVHPVAARSGPSLTGALLAHTGGALSHCGEAYRPGVVHRLDRDSTGVLLFAKTDDAHRALAQQFEKRSVKKIYEALAHGIAARPAGTATGSVGRDPHRRTRRTVLRLGGKEARTDWEAFPCGEQNFTHFILRPRSGRTHQIRVHLAAMGHPILGDGFYGCPDREPPVPRVLLHARLLAFVHPTSGLRIAIEAPLPEDMASLLGPREDLRWQKEKNLNN
jgi:23S rRNA pseudouridine1911/1915/1917 synthase